MTMTSLFIHTTVFTMALETLLDGNLRGIEKPHSFHLLLEFLNGIRSKGRDVIQNCSVFWIFSGGPAPFVFWCFS